MKHLLLILLITGVIAQATSAQNSRPNIIIMMADDMGMGDTSAYQDFTGNSDADQIHTPNMERLARMGVRFTDAHTPSSRCSPTRYGLLTGRYPWRNRLKHWVLFGSQGDPMIERDRPTIATMLRDNGYHTAMVGKWHVGLRYRRSDGKPAAGWDDADLTQPLFDTPLDHGFDDCRFTSRSHGTSGPSPTGRKPNTPDQNVGPGHITGRNVSAATPNGKQLNDQGANAYVLEDLGGRHSDNAMEFLQRHIAGSETRGNPFFLYYASNSNHAPHTPDSHIGDRSVAGSGKSVAGQPLNARGDYVYENDVALGRMIDWLERTDDPRNAGRKLIETTIVLFTSDNGAEIDQTVATGPFRSNKGSVYEGGHRVPYLVSWPADGVGDGDVNTPGRDSQELVALHDLFATLAEIAGEDLPDLRRGEKGAEDSLSVLDAWRGKSLPDRPMFYHDHKQARDGAASAIRMNSPTVNGKEFDGKWKLFFDASLLRMGEARPVELFDLHTDPEERHDRLSDAELKPLIEYLTRLALQHRNSGGHRLANMVSSQRIIFDWTKKRSQRQSDASVVQELASRFEGQPAERLTAEVSGLTMFMQGVNRSNPESTALFTSNDRGLGLSSGRFKQVENGEALLISFDEDVMIESAAIVAGNGTCGGFYQVGNHAPLAIYCVDADIDAKDQFGLLSDIGILKKGQTLKLDSSPHFGTETPGQWRLASLTVRRLKE